MQAKMRTETSVDKITAAWYWLNQQSHTSSINAITVPVQVIPFLASHDVDWLRSEQIATSRSEDNWWWWSWKAEISILTRSPSCVPWMITKKNWISITNDGFLSQITTMNEKLYLYFMIVVDVKWRQFFHWVILFLFSNAHFLPLSQRFREAVKYGTKIKDRFVFSMEMEEGIKKSKLFFLKRRQGYMEKKPNSWR